MNPDGEERPPCPPDEPMAIAGDPERTFDEIVRLAAGITRCETALVSLIAGLRPAVDAGIGVDSRDADRIASLCALAARSKEPLVVPDARADPRFVDLPLVRSGRVRFYAGVPLELETGRPPAGALCVVSREPRPGGFTDEQARQLVMLARLAAERLRARLLLRRLRSADSDRREQRHLIQAMKRTAGVGFALLDAEGRFMEVNEPVARLLDVTVAELVGVNPLSFTVESARGRVRAALSACLRGGFRITGDWPMRRHDGDQRTARVTSERLHLNGVPYVFCVLTDATLERTEEMLRETQAETLKAVALERPLREILANVGSAVRARRADAAVLITHLQAGHADVEYAEGLSTADLSDLRCVWGSDPATVAFFGLRGRDLPEPWARREGVGSVWSLPLIGMERRLLGKLYVVLPQQVVPTDVERQFLEGLTDVAGFALERQDMMLELRARAEYDPLTGLANRALLEDRLRQQLRLCRRSGRSAAVLLIDLDDFKAINDTLGHHAGDELLVAVARRLTGTLRESDTVARPGGDEFVVVLPDTDADTAGAVAEKLLEVLSRSVVLDGRTVSVRPSIGVAVSGSEETDHATLLRRADKAMYRAKAAGKGRIWPFRGHT